MFNVFGTRRKTPTELVTSAVEALVEPLFSNAEKRDAQLEKAITSIRGIFDESSEHPKDRPQLVRELLKQRLLPLLLEKAIELPLPFHRATLLVWVAALEYKELSGEPATESSESSSIAQPSVHPAVIHFATEEPDVMDDLVRGYELKEMSLVCGAILQAAIPHRELAAVLLTRPIEVPSLFRLFTYVKFPEFEIAADAFATFKALVTSHADLVAACIATNLNLFTSSYVDLTQAKVYMVQRMTLAFLPELLRLDTKFGQRYLSNVDNLKFIMKKLNDDKPSIQHAALAVLKVFTTTPLKADGVLRLLVKNKDQLASYVATVAEMDGAENFEVERQELLEAIHGLEYTPAMIEAVVPSEHARSMSLPSTADNKKVIEFAARFGQIVSESNAPTATTSTRSISLNPATLGAADNRRSSDQGPPEAVSTANGDRGGATKSDAVCASSPPSSLPQPSTTSMALPTPPTITPPTEVPGISPPAASSTGSGSTGAPGTALGAPGTASPATTSTIGIRLDDSTSNPGVPAGMPDSESDSDILFDSDSDNEEEGSSKRERPVTSVVVVSASPPMFVASGAARGPVSDGASISASNLVLPHGKKVRGTREKSKDKTKAKRKKKDNKKVTEGRAPTSPEGSSLSSSSSTPSASSSSSSSSDSSGVFSDSDLVLSD